MLFHAVLVLVFYLRILVMGLLAFVCWRWWRHTQRWSFLVLAVCAALWFTEAFVVHVYTNVTEFGKSPEEVAKDGAGWLSRHYQVGYCFDLGVLLACMVAGINLARCKFSDASSYRPPEA